VRAERPGDLHRKGSHAAPPEAQHVVRGIQDAPDRGVQGLIW
jgi:hypothetical protein